MKIGTLIIKIYGELLEKQSIQILLNAMHPILNSVSTKFDSDHKRFGYFATSLIWVAHLKSFWANDHIYTVLKETLNQYFTNWTIDITLTIEEKGGTTHA